jgi:hypothetical protein
MEEKLKKPQKKLSSLSDLGQLLSDSGRKQPIPEVKRHAHDGKNKTVRVSIDSKEGEIGDSCRRTSA